MTTSLLLASAGPGDPGRILAAIALVALGGIAIGTTALLLRILLPGVSAGADRALAAMSGRRLVTAGILPLVGAGLLARGVHMAGDKTLGVVYLLVVVLPLALAWIAGVMAGLPHIGARLLSRGEDAPPLLRGGVGGLVTGFAAVTWIVPPLGVLVTLLVVGWFLAIGVGAVLGMRGTKDQIPDANRT